MLIVVPSFREVSENTVATCCGVQKLSSYLTILTETVMHAKVFTFWQAKDYFSSFSFAVIEWTAFGQGDLEINSFVCARIARW